MDWVALGSAALPLLGTGANAWSQGSMNRASRQFAQEQSAVTNDRNIANWKMQNEYNEGAWNKQNTYNEGLWNKQNEYNEQIWQKMNQYNSPVSQMERYKEAGLNPNLIYGQSSQGGSISTANLEPANRANANIPGASAGQWHPDPIKFDLEKGLLSYLQFRESSARTNNLEKLNKVYEEDASLKKAQITATLAGAAKTDVERALSSALFQTNVDAADANLRKVQVETDLSISKNEREAAMNASNLREAAQRILNMRGQNMTNDIERQIKEKDLEWRRFGITPSDNLLFRVLGMILGDPQKTKWMEIPKMPDGSYKIYPNQK